MMKQSKKYFLVALTAALAALPLLSQAGPISLTSGGYTQDFNGLLSSGGSGANTVMPNTEIVNALFWTGTTGTDISTGWWANNTGQNYGYACGGTVSANNGRVASFGSTDGATERAFGLGFQAAGGFGAQFQNDTGAAISQLDIEYDGEQWYQGNVTVGLTFEYSLDATSLMDAAATWVAVTDLDFTAPNALGVWQTGDGNLAANREADISHSITGLNIANGATFFIRWGADGDGKGLGIDNFSITSGAALPGPPSFSTSPTVKPTALIDVAYSESLEGDVSEGDGDAVTYTKLSGPAWLDIATGTGALTGTPTAADSGATSSNHVFLVELSDVDGATTGEVHIVVSTGVGTIPTFTANPTVKSSATADSAYSGDLSGDVSEPDGDTVTFDKVSGPDWLNVADGGLISGIPGASNVGLNVFEIEVSDVDGASTGTVNITVGAAPLPDPGDAVNVDVNWNIEHSVGGVSDFGRERHMTVHSNVIETDWDGEEDKLDYLINDLDVYFGRDNGSATWKFQATTQDPERPNHPDLASMSSLGNWLKSEYDKKPDRSQYEPRTSEMIMGTTPHPLYPTLSWYANGFTWDGWQPKDVETSTEWVVEYLDLFFRKSGETSGEKMPMYWEVINEPDMELMTGKFMVSSWESLWKYHNLVATGVRERLGDDAPLIGGMTWGLHDLWQADQTRFTSNHYPDLILGNDPSATDGAEFYRAAGYTAYPRTGADWEQWDTIWKGFVDACGTNMDFYSIHLYDWPSWGKSSAGTLRSGGVVEATLEMMEWYDVHKFGVENRKPIVLSEYGAVAGYEQILGLDPHRQHWEDVTSFNAMIMQFLERPDYIVKSMPFTPIKATWGDYYVGEDLYRYSSRMMDETFEGSGVWEWTEFIKFFELWSDVDGTRVDTKAGDLDIQVDAYVDGNKGYLIFNNLEATNKTLKVNTFGASLGDISSVRVKHLYLDMTLGVDGPDDDTDVDGRPVLDEYTLKTAPGSVTLGANASMILEYTFASPMVPDQTEVETKFYGESLSGTTPFRTEATTLTAYVNGVDVPTGPAEATLRISGKFVYNSVMLDDSRNQITINGHDLEYIADWRGEKGGEWRWFGTLEVPVPAEYLQANNTITCTVLQSMAYTTVNLVVNEFSQAPGRSATTANVPVTGVSITEASLSISEQRTSSVQAVITPSNASDARIVWTSSNPSAATVDETGRITANAAGSATISATTVDGSFADTVPVTVTAFVPFAVEGIRVNPASIYLDIGDTGTVVETVFPAEAADQSVTWSSDNPSVATVDAAGQVIAVSGGTATITGTTTDGGFTDTALVSVVLPPSVTGVTVSPSTCLVAAGTSYQLSKTVYPSGANAAVTWSSETPSVATVGAGGLVTGVSDGTARIVATTVDGGYTSASVATVFTASSGGTSFTVEAEDFITTGGVSNSGIGINYVQSGDWAEYDITVPEDGIYQVEYLVGTVNDGTVIQFLLDGTAVDSYTVVNTGDWDTYTTQAAGYFEMTAGDHAVRLVANSAVEWQWTLDSFTLTKVAGDDPVPVDGVSVSPTSDSIAVGATTQLSATVSPANASDKSVTWTSLNPTVATVSSSGLVSALVQGSAEIVVTTVDGGFTATNELAVTAGSSVDGVSVSPVTSQVSEGATVQLTATVSPSDALDKSVTWSSLSPSIATVDSSGLVSGVAEGSASIVVTTVEGGFSATNVTTVIPLPPEGPVMEISIVDGEVVISATNGTSDAYFRVLANTNLLEGAGWQVVASNLTFDAAGDAIVSNSTENASQIFFKIEEGSDLPPPTELTATFDWEDVTTGIDWWTGYDYEETDNGVTMVSGGRAASWKDTAGTGKAMKASYADDAVAGTFVMQISGVDKPFCVDSIDIGANIGEGTYQGAPLVQGMLGGAEQWSITPAVAVGVQTYTAATSGDMSLEIDQIVWNSVWDDPGGTVYENEIDNLQVTVSNE